MLSAKKSIFLLLMLELPEKFELWLQAHFKQEATNFRESLNQKAPVSIRVNPQKIPRSIGLLERVSWAKSAYYLPERPVFTLDPLFHVGAYYVQESNSMFLEHMFKSCVDTEHHILALDLCASPGGKSTHLLSLLKDSDLLVANEVIQSRAKVLLENVQKWGNANVVVTNNDPSRFTSLKAMFDLIVIDAPCSGEGMFRKDAAAITQWSEANVKLCCERQQRIVADAWPALKEGGILFYCTCTFNDSENEANLEWLSSEFEAESIKIDISDYPGIDEVCYKGMYGYHFYPHKTRGEGFFISAVQKTMIEPGRHKSKKNKRNKISKLDSGNLQIMDDWITPNDNYLYLNDNGLVRLFPEQWMHVLQELGSELYLLNAGVQVGDIIKNKLKPDHHLAMSGLVDLSKINYCDATYEQALKYLYREDVRFDNEHKNQWQLVRYANINLGWIKNIGNRNNNYYPKEWRIRKQFDLNSAHFTLSDLL